jgi:hypothetical protein
MWRAAFAPDKMGKKTMVQRDFLFVGLNAFEPGQEHALHVHDALDKLYFILEGTAVVQIGDGQRFCLPEMRPTRRLVPSTRFAIAAPSVSSLWWSWHRRLKSRDLRQRAYLIGDAPAHQIVDWKQCTNQIALHFPQ